MDSFPGERRAGELESEGRGSFMHFKVARLEEENPWYQDC